MKHPLGDESHRGSWIRMGCGFLDVPQRNAGVEGCGDERVPYECGEISLSIPPLLAKRFTNLVAPPQRAPRLIV